MNVKQDGSSMVFLQGKRQRDNDQLAKRHQLMSRRVVIL